MKILFIGDIVGKPGRNAVKKFLPELVEKNDIDFVIANGENLAAGSGMTYEKYKEMIEAGIDLFTSGNHIWKNKDIIPHLSDPSTKILRPLNYPQGAEGRGATVLEKNGKELMVINLQGRVFMSDDILDPFTVASGILENAKYPTLIDFHAEATSEKIALSHYLDGKVAALVGTHTHVQTADEIILKEGTGYITDVGMTGPIDSVLGVEKDIIIQKFLTQLPASHKVATGEVNFCGVILELEEKGQKCLEIKRINENINAN